MLRRESSRCSVQGCKKAVRARGLCYGHGRDLMPQCTIEGCKKPRNAHGLCMAHERRLHLYGDPLGSAQRPARNQLCSVEGCIKPNERKGLCQMHHRRLEIHGDVHARNYRTGCDVEGCKRYHKSNGLCDLHYRRMQRTGTTDDPPPPILDPKRYRQRKYPGHPLAHSDERAYVHRVVLYDAIGPGSHPCHWCGKFVRWERSARKDAGALVVDHLDHNRHNNAVGNLVPACNTCNVKRTRRQSMSRAD